MIDLGLAFSFPFADKDWFKKLIIPGLIGLIPLIGQIAFYGWWVEVTRRVIRQQPDPLPDFSDFAGYLTDGLKGIELNPRPGPPRPAGLGKPSIQLHSLLQSERNYCCV